MTPYDSPEWHALVNAVYAEPDCDLPRLVAADWLDSRIAFRECDHCTPELRLAGYVNHCICGGSGGISNGCGERATFVRSQCTGILARIPSEMKPGWLLKGHPGTIETFTMPSGDRSIKAIDDGRAIIIYSRGFPSSITCPLAAWLQHGPALARREHVGWVVLSDREPYFGHAYNSWWWIHASERRGDNPTDTVPACLWNLMANGEPGRRIANMYSTRELADAALSAAAIRWARGVSG